MDLDEPQSPTPVEEMQKSEKAATFVEHAPTKGKRGRPKGVPSAPRPKKPATASGAASTPGTSAFPISRVAKIVKADKEIAMCQKEAIFLMSVATEHFIKRLSDAAYTNSRMDQSKQIRYKDLVTACAPENGDVPGDFFFLEELINKNTHGQYTPKPTAKVAKQDKPVEEVTEEA